MTDEAPTLLTSTQAGRLLGVSGRTVLRMAERNEIRVAAKLPGINGPRLFDADEVQRLALTWATGKPKVIELDLGVPRRRMS